MWEYPYSRPPHCGKQRNLNMKSRGIEALSSAGHNDNNQFGPDGQALALQLVQLRIHPLLILTNEDRWSLSFKDISGSPGSLEPVPAPCLVWR